MSNRHQFSSGYVLDYLFSIDYVRPEDLLFGCIHMPKIWYTWDKKSHRYYTDFAIVHTNIIFEVKSIRTLQIQWTQNIAKFMASVYQGYELHVIVWDEPHKHDKLKAHVIFKTLDNFVDGVLYLAMASNLVQV